jgi:hypothetical protein
MRKLSIVAATLILAACGSMGGLGDLGTILGSPSTTQPSDVVATVNSVDVNAQRIDVNANYINGLRESQANQSIYYDANTRVVYQNNSNYKPADLERGDQITVRGSNNNGRYLAETITVTKNVRQ